MKKHNGGYFRQILHIDMTGGASRTEAIDDESHSIIIPGIDLLFELSGEG